LIPLGTVFSLPVPPRTLDRVSAGARERLIELTAELPGAEWEASGRHLTLRVRGRTFAYLLDDHQGDGILGVVGKAAPGEAEALIAGDPERYYPPAYLHHRGWIGLRLDREPVDWEEVAGLVTDSYLLVAPKRLAREAIERSGSSPGDGGR
jgi:predicted DNA-binding protein (MmcQ/YjbR family)